MKLRPLLRSYLKNIQMSTLCLLYSLKVFLSLLSSNLFQVLLHQHDCQIFYRSKSPNTVYTLLDLLLLLYFLSFFLLILHLPFLLFFLRYYLLYLLLTLFNFGIIFLPSYLLYCLSYPLPVYLLRILFFLHCLISFFL